MNVSGPHLDELALLRFRSVSNVARVPLILAKRARPKAGRGPANARVDANGASHIAKKTTTTTMRPFCRLR